MGFVPAPNTAMAELRGTLLGQKVENTLYFEASAAMSLTLMADLADALETWWRSNVAPLQSTSFLMREIFITDLTTNTSPTFSQPVTTSNTGTENGTVKPNNVSVCISFRTAGRGKSARGRNYTLGLTDNLVSGNQIVSTAAASYVTAYSLLIGAGTFVSGLQWVVVSRRHNKADRVTALVQPITAALFADINVDSQRRRLPGRGL